LHFLACHDNSFPFDRRAAAGAKTTRYLSFSVYITFLKVAAAWAFAWGLWKLVQKSISNEIGHDVLFTCT
jgi:hypothetical protein